MDPTKGISGFDEKIDVAKKMFWGGFLFLPWLWVVNWLLFRAQLQKPSCPEDLKWYINWSFRLFLPVVCLVVVWYIVYAIKLRGPDWDNIALVIPKGP